MMTILGYDKKTILTMPSTNNRILDGRLSRSAVDGTLQPTSGNSNAGNQNNTNNRYNLPQQITM